MSLAKRKIMPRNEPEQAAEVRPEELRLLEAMLFASAEPIDEKDLAARLPEGTNLAGGAGAAARGLRQSRRQSGAHRRQMDLPHRHRPVVAAEQGNDRAAQALARRDRDARDHRLSPAGDAQRDRGVARCLDLRRLRRRAAGDRLDPSARPPQVARPPGDLRHHREFLSHFGLDAVGDLPGLEELKGAGMFDGRLPAGFSVPMPSDDAALRDDEDPLEPGDLDLGLAPPSERRRSNDVKARPALSRSETPTQARLTGDRPRNSAISRSCGRPAANSIAAAEPEVLVFVRPEA